MPLFSCGFPDYLGGLALFTYDFSIMDEERLISLMPYDRCLPPAGLSHCPHRTAQVSCNLCP